MDCILFNNLLVRFITFKYLEICYVASFVLLPRLHQFPPGLWAVFHASVIPESAPLCKKCTLEDPVVNFGQAQKAKFLNCHGIINQIRTVLLPCSVCTGLEINLTEVKIEGDERRNGSLPQQEISSLQDSQAWIHRRRKCQFKSNLTFVFI